MMHEAPPTPTAQPPRFGRYQVGTSLGATRLTEVYTATDERLQRQVLLHLLRQDLLGQARPQARFVAEVSQMARRSHQGLLEIFDRGEVDGRPFIVTEQCAGRPLRSLNVLTVEHALLYVRQIAGAVAVCQVQASAELPVGLYHPPISSSNVLLVGESRVKLVDSWLVPAAEVAHDLAHYRAPELSEGRPATTATAVYALGLLLFELITGARPVGGADARATALEHLTLNLPLLRQMRSGLYLPSVDRLLAQATARDPEQRFRDAHAFNQALDGLWRDLGAATQRLEPSARRGRAAVEAKPVPTPPAEVALPPAPAMSARRVKRNAPPVSPAPAQSNLTRNLVGWLMLVGLVLAVALGSYLAVNAVADRLGSLPSFPPLPSGLFGSHDVLYTVNIREGLNLRREPNATDAGNVITVVPTGTVVRKLAGPQIADNIPWLRVSAEVNGVAVEGWLSMNYLILKGSV